MIVGATSAIAEQCARLWVREPVDLTLLGRDAARLERIAADLKVRSPHATIRVRTAEFSDPQGIQAAVAATFEPGAVDIALIAHGFLPDQELCQSDLPACRDALALNGISPVLYAEAFAQYMTEHDRGTLAVIGSVAGDRGRKSNYVYGAAKGMIDRYVQGLQHRFAGSGVSAVLLKPGPTRTPMTAHLDGSGLPLAPAEEVARKIVAAIDRKQPVAYVPGRWRWIMLILRHLPGAIFNRLNI